MTVVTSLLDLGAREANREKTAEHYLELGQRLLEALQGMRVVLYVEPDLAIRMQALAMASGVLSTIIPYRLEDSPAYASLDTIRAARSENPLRPTNARKDTALYAVFQRTKMHLLRQTAEQLLCSGVHHLSWIDLGISQVIPLVDVKGTLERSVKLLTDLRTPNGSAVVLCHFEPLRRVTEYLDVRTNVLAGLLVGEAHALIDLTCKVESRARILLAQGIAPHDETILEDVAVDNLDWIKRRPLSRYDDLFT